MSTCSVCCATYNKSNHKKVSCPSCDYESCRTCIQTYLLSSVEDPHCMECKINFSREYVDSFCTKKFRNVDYRNHRENVLYDREMARMPETQPYAERRIKMDTLKRKYYDLMDTLVLMRASRNDARRLNHEMGLYDIAIDELRRQLTSVVNEANDIENSDIDTGILAFTRKCPSETCRGFLDAEWMCGLCDKTFCEQCCEELLPNHECDEKTVETMKLINKDTKPCPKCGTMIHKIDGCAQMWCTDCHTAFDWRSGHIETGRVHNPHYFEFKTRSREHGDIPCGGRPMYNELAQNGANEYLIDLSYKLSHIDRELIYKYGGIYDDDNLHLRVSYLLKHINDETFKKELQRRDKEKSKLKDIRNVYEMFADTCGDLLRQWILDTSRTWDILHIVHELANYSNWVISQIRKRYNSSLPHYIFLKTLKKSDVDI
jgi:hypothetical protein